MDHRTAVRNHMVIRQRVHKQRMAHRGEMRRRQNIIGGIGDRAGIIMMLICAVTMLMAFGGDASSRIFDFLIEVGMICFVIIYVCGIGLIHTYSNTPHLTRRELQVTDKDRESIIPN